MSDNIYKACATCAACIRGRLGGAMKCAEGHRVVRFAREPLACWRPKPDKGVKAKGDKP